MMETKETVLDILEEITGTDEVRENPDLDLFGEGILDSLGVVQFLVELEARCGVSVPASEFDRSRWATPRDIADRAAEWAQ
ncbi:MAG: D-alanine--poly(phosphoribitol) ligase subunit DltC [Clostridiales Family XIII bacterium]|jgi:D-alanine--poly(phosphoribitol) ligase subunit 2|nr:D-alanine--poly(phosphoribitol) ligase subunit DltC [Clostridiales Family XIII bacterium]